MSKVIKAIRVLLCGIVLLIGLGWWFLNILIDEYKYVNYVMSNVSDVQRSDIEYELGISLPEDFLIEKLVTQNTFVSDMPHTVYLYTNYSYNKANELKDMIISENITYTVSVSNGKTILNISYNGVRNCSLHSIVIENGTEERGRYIAICIVKLLIVLLCSTLCVIPYEKIYRKLNGL